MADIAGMALGFTRRKRQAYIVGWSTRNMGNAINTFTNGTKGDIHIVKNRIEVHKSMYLHWSFWSWFLGSWRTQFFLHIYMHIRKAA